MIWNFYFRYDAFQAYKGQLISNADKRNVDDAVSQPVSVVIVASPNASLARTCSADVVHCVGMSLCSSGFSSTSVGHRNTGSHVPGHATT